MPFYTFKRNCKVYIVANIDGILKRYKLEVYPDLSFSQTFDEQAINVKTLHDQDAMFEDAIINKANPANFSFTVLLNDSSSYEALANLLGMSNTERDGSVEALYSSDIYIDTGVDTFKLEKAVLERATFTIQKDSLVTVNISGTSAKLLKYGISGVVLPGIDSTVPPELPAVIVRSVIVELDGIEVPNISGISLELVNNVEWLNYDTLHKSLDIDTPPETMFPETFFVSSKVVSGNIQQYVSDTNTARLQQWSTNSSLRIRVGDVGFYYLDVDMPSVVFTNRLDTQEVFLQVYDFRMKSNGVPLETIFSARKRFTLSALTGMFSLSEDAAQGTIAGSIKGSKPGSTLTLINNGANRVALVGTNIIRGPAPLDYETAPLISFTVRETNPYGTNSPRDTTLTLSVTNVAESTLNTLSGTFTLPENCPAGTVAGAILNKTAGSTLSLIDDAGGMVALSGNNIVRGSGSVDFEYLNTIPFTVRETLADAINSPKDTTLTLNITDIAELIPNGTFDYTTDGVIPSSGALLEISSGRLRVINTADSPSYGYVIFTTEPYRSYTVNVEKFNGTGGSQARVGTAPAAFDYAITNSQGVASFVATGNTTYVTLRNTSSVKNTYAEYDNLSAIALPLILSAPTASVNQNTINLSVYVNSSIGTLYWVATESATKPTSTQIKAGQNHLGVVAPASGTKAITQPNTYSSTTPNLQAGHSYYIHFYHESSTTAPSNIVSSSVATISAGETLTLSGTAPTAKLNIAYTFTPVRTGGSGPFVYVISSGTAPAWLNLNTSTGQLTGTPQ